MPQAHGLVSQALKQPVAQLHHELQRASVCHADETCHQSHSHTLWRGYWSVGGASSPHDLACGMHHQLKLLAVFRVAKNPRPVFVQVRITAEVISCSGGFWSACWSDVIARMVTVPMPNAAFER